MHDYVVYYKVRSPSGLEWVYAQTTVYADTWKLAQSAAERDIQIANPSSEWLVTAVAEA